MVREAPRLRSPELEAVHGYAADFQYRTLCVRLSGSITAAVDAPQLAWPRNDRTQHDLQYRHLVCHQHGYSALLRRSNLFQFQPDILLHTDVLSVGRHRPVRFDRDHSRISERFASGQLLRRYVAGGYLHVSSSRVRPEHHPYEPG